MQRAWLREFNGAGLQLRPKASKLVADFLSVCDDSQQVCENLVEFTKQYLRSRQGKVDAIIDEDVIRGVLQCMQDLNRAAGDVITTQDAAKQGIEALDLGDGVFIYDVTREVKPFVYSRVGREWTVSHDFQGALAGPDAKARIYADRYHLLLQRLLLEGKFVTEDEAAGGALLPGQRVLTKVESLQGNPGNKVTFGLISKSQDEGKRTWLIEDLHKVYAIDLRVEESSHLITDGCFVLAEGQMEEGRFVVRKLDVPEAVPRHLTFQKDLAPRQMFGGNLTDEQIRSLEECEVSTPDGFYVVLCEVHLDDVRVLEKLTDLFQTYEQMTPPTAYVFMGSFCSQPFVSTESGVRSYQQGFHQLKFMMGSLTNHVEKGTRFIFIAGPNDPGAHTLPRVPLPKYLTSDLSQDIPNVVFASNPCRVRHLNQDMVFFRHDVLRLLRRHELVPLRDPETGGPASAEQVRNEMVRFLLDQAHLVPMPLEQSNLIWSYDHALRLYPLPSAVFVGGISQPFDTAYQGCKFCSVGPFHRDAEFYAFHPVKGDMEPCDVPDRTN